MINPNINPLMLTDVYNTSHCLLKENQDFEKSIIMNRNKPQILFGLNEVINDICNIKIEEIMVEDDDFEKSNDKNKS